MATNIVGGERRFPDLVANNFTDLSINYPAALYTNQYAEVINGQSGGWIPGWLGGTYYSKGFYKSNGTTWEYVGSFPYQATQIEVDAGTVEDKFVTPKTFNDSAQLSTIRNPIFTVELINYLTIDFYAPFAMSIDSVTAITNSPTTTIQKNGTAYTLGSSIAIGDRITVTVNVVGVVNLTTTRL